MFCTVGRRAGVISPVCVCLQMVLADFFLFLEKNGFLVGLSTKVKIVNVRGRMVKC